MANTLMLEAESMTTANVDVKFRSPSRELQHVSKSRGNQLTIGYNMVIFNGVNITQRLIDDGKAEIDDDGNLWVKWNGLAEYGFSSPPRLETMA